MSELLSHRKPSAASRIAPMFGAIVFLLLLWTMVSIWRGSQFFPTPLAVFQAAGNLIVSGEFFKHFIATIWRISVGFSISFSIAILLALLMKRGRFLKRFLQFQVTFGLTIPSLAWSVISVMLWGLNDGAAIFTVVMATLPVITTTLYEGMKNLDPNLSEVAEVYHFKKSDQFRFVVFPQLLPFVFGAVRYGLSLAWKTVVITEMLGLTSGLGYQISYWFGLLSMQNVLAWTMLFTLAMLALEYWVIQRVELHLLKWKPIHLE